MHKSLIEISFQEPMLVSAVTGRIVAVNIPLPGLYTLILAVDLLLR